VWSNFYESRCNSAYDSFIVDHYNPFITALATAGENGTYIEVGCGRGSITKALFSRVGGRHLLIDNDKKMLDMARSNIDNNEIAYSLQNALRLNITKRVNVIHSHGVLEHFKDKEIKKILDNQLEYADYVMHYVPGNKYIKPSYGDERLLSVAEWQQICKPDAINVFNGGLDYILKWWRKSCSGH
jgi:trans-aconitate methyltransferase